MKKFLIVSLTLIFSYMSALAQLPPPDILSKMVIATINIDKARCDYDCYLVRFNKGATSLHDRLRSLDYKASELDYSVDDFMMSLNANEQGYLFHSYKDNDRCGESFRQFLKRHKIKLPCSVLIIWVSSSEDGIVDIGCTSTHYLRRRLGKFLVSVNYDSDCIYTWKYDSINNRYEIISIDHHKFQDNEGLGISVECSNSGF